MTSDVLSTWADGPAKEAIVGFVDEVCGPAGVPIEERIAVFDNDGTLWCEKPMPIQLDFILRRLREMADHDAALRDRQPWKAAYDQDYGWLGKVLADHYAGDDREVPTLAAGVLAAHGGISVEEFEHASRRVLAISAAPDARARLPRDGVRADGRAAGVPGRRTASRTTSHPVAAATSCGRSPTRCTASRGNG